MLQMLTRGMRDQINTYVTGEGWQVEVGHLPPTPDRVVSLYDTGGLPPNPKWLLDYPSSQALIRGRVGDYEAAHNVGLGVKDTLLGMDPADIGGDRWVSVTLGSDLTFIGMDENQRPQFSVNFRFIIEPGSSAETNRTPL